MQTLTIKVSFLLAFIIPLTTAAAEDPAIVLAEHIFNDKPTKECHASTIVETPAGLVAAWFGGAEEGNKDVGIWISRRESGGWSKPVESFTGVQPDGVQHPC